MCALMAGLEQVVITRFYAAGMSLGRTKLYSFGEGNRAVVAADAGQGLLSVARCSMCVNPVARMKNHTVFGVCAARGCSSEMA